MITARSRLAAASLAVVAVAGCASQAPPSSSSANESVRTLEITVTGTTVDPAPSQVDLAVGETLLLVVTADGGSEIHAHGVSEVAVPITAGEPATLELTGEVPGVYEVEMHDPDLQLLQVAVR